MDTPDLSALRDDLEGVPFRAGALQGWWDVVAPEALGESWPFVVFWVEAASRSNAPSRFSVRLDCAGYPVAGPTGNFWDQEAKQPLAFDRRPKGADQVNMVFRTDWEGGRAFYHPFDRLAASTHSDWSTKYSGLQWHRERSIADFLEIIHGLLHSKDYTGV